MERCSGRPQVQNTEFQYPRPPYHTESHYLEDAEMARSTTHAEIPADHTHGRTVALVRQLVTWIVCDPLGRIRGRDCGM